MNKEKLKLGGWYTSSNWSPTSVLKFSHVEKGDQIHGTEAYIKRKKAWEETPIEHCYWSDRGGFREITGNELIDYLPAGHEDIPDEAYAGRYVKALKDGPHGITPLKKGNYARFTNDGNYLDLLMPGVAAASIMSKPCLSEENGKFELMHKGFVLTKDYTNADTAPTPVKEVKESLVGRYFKALKDSPQGGSVKAGEYGLITEGNGDKCIVNFPSQNPYYVSSYEKHPDQFELMPESWAPSTSCTPKTPESLEGRYIKALIDKPNSGMIKAGEYGLITKDLMDEYSKLYADFPSQKHYGVFEYYMHPHKYQLMPKGWTPDADVAKPTEWAPGTYVVFLRDYGGRSKGTVAKILSDYSHACVKVDAPFHECKTEICNLSKDTQAKWFATQQEALAYASGIVIEDKMKPTPSKPPTEEQKLIEEAKRRYPIGTKFYPAHIDSERQDEYCIVTTNEYLYEHDCIYAVAKNKSESDSGGYSTHATEGNTVYNRVVYDTQKGWAKIRAEKADVESKPKTAVDTFLESNSFKRGEIYYAKESDRSWLIMFDAMEHSKTRNIKGVEGKMIHNRGALCITSYSFHPNSNPWGLDTDVTLIREATKSEKDWFLKCVKARKYVDETTPDPADVVPTRPTFADCIERFHHGVHFCNEILGYTSSRILGIDKPPQQGDFLFFANEIRISSRCLDYKDGGNWTIWENGKWADIHWKSSQEDYYKEKESDIFAPKPKERPKIVVVKKEIKKLKTVKQ